MKKIISVLLTMAVLMCGCGNPGISQEEYDQLSSSNSELKEENDKISKEYEAYKEQIKQYEDVFKYADEIKDYENLKSEIKKKERRKNTDGNRHTRTVSTEARTGARTGKCQKSKGGIRLSCLFG